MFDADLVWVAPLAVVANENFVLFTFFVTFRMFCLLLSPLFFYLGGSKWLNATCLNGNSAGTSSL